MAAAPTRCPGLSWLRLTAVLAAMAVVAGACGGDAESGSPGEGGTEPYELVLVGSQTGAASVVGLAGLAGYQTVFNLVNEAGGIDGHELEWVVLDDQSSTTVASAVAQEAVADDPVAILDSAISTYFNARLPIFSSARVPVFTGNATSGALQPWLYSTNVTPSQNADAAAAMAAGVLDGSLEGKRVAFVGTDTPSVSAAVPIVEENVEDEGGSVSSVEFRPPDALDFTSGAANVVDSNPDAVVIFDINAPLVAQALISSGFEGPIVSNYGAATDIDFETVDSPQYFGQRFVRQAAPGTEMLEAAERFGFADAATASTHFGNSWAAAQLLVEALRDCGFPCDDHAALLEATDSIGTFEVPGDVTFGALNVSADVHNTLTDFQLFQWDPSSNSPVEFGEPIETNPPEYD